LLFNLIHVIFFCLEAKETKIQGDIFFSYKLFVKAKTSKLASLKQQMFFNALTL